MFSKKAQKSHYSKTIAPQESKSSKDNKGSESKNTESKAPKKSSIAFSAPYATRLVRDEIASSKTDSRTMLTKLKAESTSVSSSQHASRLNGDETKSSFSSRKDPSRLNRDDLEENEIDWKNVSRMPTMPSQYKDSRDNTMASRQVKIESLPPKEQAEQEQWAQKRLPEIGPCPAGFDWTRVENGYRCSGGFHFITHELLAEGIPGYYSMWGAFGGYWSYPQGMTPGGRQGGPGMLGESSQGVNLVPADGYWWMGPIYMQVSQVRRNSRGLPRRNGLLEGRRPPPGLGDSAPTPQDFGVSSWQQIGIKFPKGMNCKPGKGFSGPPDRRQLHPYQGFGEGFAGPGGYNTLGDGYGGRHGRQI